MFKIDYFGKPIYSMEYNVKDDQLESVKYVNFIDNSDFELIRDKNTNEDFLKDTFLCTTKRYPIGINIKKRLPQFLITPDHLSYKYLTEPVSVPEIFTYENSEKQDDKFKVTIKSGTKDYDLTFSKNLNVALYRESKHCKVFNIPADNRSTFSEKSEEYYFNDHGFFCCNYSDNVYSCLVDDVFIEYKLLLNRSPIKGLEGSFVHKLATLIEYNGHKHFFVLNYDKFGLVNSCEGRENKQMLELCRYDDSNFEKDGVIFSLHPLLFDKFHYDYNSKDPLRYWALDYLEFSKYTVNTTFLHRTIFEVDNENLPKLLDCIKNKENKLEMTYI